MEMLTDGYRSSNQGHCSDKEVIMLRWAWAPQLWAEQMMYFVWMLMEIVGIAVALLIILATVLGMLEWIRDEATSEFNPGHGPLVHVWNRRQRKSADV
jgi:CDP-diglyceride synthetase